MRRIGPQGEAFNPAHGGVEPHGQAHPQGGDRGRDAQDPGGPARGVGAEQHAAFTALTRDLQVQLVMEKEEAAGVLEEETAAMQAELEEMEKMTLPHERKPIAIQRAEAATQTGGRSGVPRAASPRMASSCPKRNSRA